MKKAFIVDKDYGSISVEDLNSLKNNFKKLKIELELAHFETDNDIIVNCQDTVAILCTGNPPITKNVIKSLPKLRIIQRFGVGVNSIDLEAATEKGVIVLNIPGFCADELAAHATSLILGLTRNTTYYDRQIRKGKWPKAEYYEPKSIPEMTIGLFGFGKSAKALYKVFKKGFNSRVITFDPNIDNQTSEKCSEIETVDFNTLLNESDVISLHAPLNEKTKHVFNREAFKKMKSDSMIVNVARGSLINQTDLISALKNRDIRFAGLDVFEREPLEEGSPLLQMENVMLSSHSAFYGEASKKNQLNITLELVCKALNNYEVGTKYIANKEVIKRASEFNYE